MAETLVLPLYYLGNTLELEVRAYRYGHTHRVEVGIGGQPVLFEPDEEGNYRALALATKDADLGLVCAVAHALDDLSD